MSYVKNLSSIVNLKSNLLKIKVNSSFIQTLKLIKNKKRDFILVEKPRTEIMLAILIHKILGRKFIWIQSFENPPVPNIIEKLLLSQADKIIVTSKKDFHKLKNFGVEKSKIHYHKKS